MPESIDAPPNALASHSYTFIFDPFTQMGVGLARNAFYDESAPDGLSAIARSFIAGVLGHPLALQAA